MIRTELEPGRWPDAVPAYVVHYRTAKREGFRRFGGLKGRELATLFAVEILKELLDN